MSPDDRPSLTPEYRVFLPGTVRHAGVRPVRGADGKQTALVMTFEVLPRGEVSR